ncbi:MAG: CoA transferase [Pseudomonadota bacterium]
MTRVLGVDGAVRFTGSDALRSVFPVTDFASASLGAAGAAMADLVDTQYGAAPPVSVDRRLASLWFGWSLRPDGWTLPPAWDPVAGDYRTQDGWIRLHTNAPHHRDAALAVLGVPAEREAVARAVANWQADALEAAVVAKNGCAAAMRSATAWAQHQQGVAVAAEPLIAIARTDAVAQPVWAFTPERPLAGIRVLDLTRILAGPIATRFLAGFGAEVLRIDPIGWEEPGVAPEVTVGKRCARLDLRDASGREALVALLREADVLVHGYRADALEKLGLGTEARRHIRPGLVDVCLNAYGWSGPWQYRRGFDSLVQMSAGIADAGMRLFGADKPTPLPVQALDHATGYLMAAAAVNGLARRLRDGAGFNARLSLARSALLLQSVAPARPGSAMDPARDADYPTLPEATSSGPAHRLLAPVSVDGAPLRWDSPATDLGSASATWQRSTARS